MPPCGISSSGCYYINSKVWVKKAGVDYCQGAIKKAAGAWGMLRHGAWGGLGINSKKEKLILLYTNIKYLQ